MSIKTTIKDTASPLEKLLDKYRKNSKTEREKGEYFELLIKDFLKNDPVYTAQFDDVWTFSEWAEANALDKRDTGIDLVAQITNGQGYCAIQCKFYDENYKIQKKDIDSFFTASGKAPFSRRIIVDTTRGDWSEHAYNALEGQTIETSRLFLRDLEQSPIDWGVYARESKVELRPKKQLREHQSNALKATQSGLSVAERGKLIMACGTGKTFTSLRIAENLVGAGGRVLYLVPSLALMSQTVREWTNDSEIPLHSFAVCSDAQVGKRKAKDDLSDINIHDLAYPATTDSKKLAEKITKNTEKEKMIVIFSTYQSIQVISESQKKYGLHEFDLIVCDEAHRTTGAKLIDEDESNFIKVHYQDYIKGKKRIYMTATPRIFGDAVKTKANEVEAVLCSMDDVSLYGETLYEVSFSYAVQHGLLTDYKVVVLAVDEEAVSASVQKRLTDQDSELILDDVTKIIGCYRALSKLDLKTDLMADVEPMRRAVAFCKDIKSSKLIQKEFAEVVEEYLNQQEDAEDNLLRCEVEHVDGTYNAKERNRLLDWLNAEADAQTCRILSNARCLSEGVDVPALDAIMFLHPRKSQIDVVQSVGRVMRRAQGKNMGYVILPVGVPAGMAPEEALNNNEKYKVVWQILNALRAHDDRFDSLINKIGLGVDVSSKIEIVAVSNQLPQRADKSKEGSNIGHGSAAGEDDDASAGTTQPNRPQQQSFEFDEFQKSILAKIVKKCGTREYWEDWANDIADIAQKHIARIKGLLKEPDTAARKSFDTFLSEIKDDLNESITESDAIEMLAQHLITQPVFEALFEDYSFANHNPVSIAMQQVLDVLHEKKLDNENRSLEKFYESVRMRAAGINNDAAKQKIIVQLYDKFFKNAFPRMTEKLGIVYTPVEVVDFIIHSVNDVLQSEFGESLGSKGVHIIDPFTGTGTFITRLLQSGYVKPEELEHKYKHEIHANEIVLLAYYIAAINIEAAYHDIQGGEYDPFKGICLTDTFQLYEKDDLISKLLIDNSSRRQKQKELDIRVIIGNPPYSSGDKEDNNNKNISYKNLDERIAQTYVAASAENMGKSKIYDSYIRAIRWGSDRIGESGVMAYVSGSAWMERSFADGMRKCLADEYTNIYVINLRGDIRKNILSKGRAKEGGNIFDSGSMTGIAITLFVKNPKSAEHGKIYYHDIGDDLSGKDKLRTLVNLKSIGGISQKIGWKEITPDAHNDWINLRDESFEAFIEMGNKTKNYKNKVFETYSMGIKSNRDAWVYNFSQKSLSTNIEKMIDFYNAECERLKGVSEEDIEGALNRDKTKIKWTSDIVTDLTKGKKHVFEKDSLSLGIYRPFSKAWYYNNSSWNWTRHLMPRMFPSPETQNQVIVVSGVGSRSGFSAFITDSMPCLDIVEKGQCFPLKVYDVYTSASSDGLFGENDKYTAKDGISTEGLRHFEKAYPKETITKEAIFYYVYGLLHSSDYQERYADNLIKELPRIPCVKRIEDFWSFSNAGRQLADLHLNYESIEPYPVSYKEGGLLMHDLKPEDYRVEGMKFGGKGKNKDKSTVIYNHKITMTNIPLEAYEYLVGGKPALEWVMERQCVKTDKESGIVNDANLYAIETVGDPAYPLKLFQRIITVSLETVKIVRSLPKLEV